MPLTMHMLSDRELEEEEEEEEGLYKVLASQPD